jgi:hypothetical protein
LIGFFFLRFHIVTRGNVFLCLTMIQKRSNIKTLGNLFINQIASCFDALSIKFVMLLEYVNINISSDKKLRGGVTDLISCT